MSGEAKEEKISWLAMNLKPSAEQLVISRVWKTCQANERIPRAADPSSQLTDGMTASVQVNQQLSMLRIGEMKMHQGESLDQCKYLPDDDFLRSYSRTETP